MSGDTEGIIHRDGEEIVALEAHANYGVLVTITANLVHFTSGLVPAGDDRVVAAGVDGVRAAVVSNSFDGLVVTLNDARGTSGATGVEVVEVTREGERDEVLSLPQATELLILYGIAELEGGYRATGFDIPDLAGLVTGRGEDLGAVGRPAAGVDTTLVTVVAGFEGVTLGTSFAIEEDTSLVLSDGKEEATVGAVSYTVDEVAVFSSAADPLVRGTLEEGDGEIFRTGGDTERLGGAEVQEVMALA